MREVSYENMKALEEALENAEATIRALTETAAENNRVKIEDHNRITELQDLVERQGKMIAAQAGLRAHLQEGRDKFLVALEEIRQAIIDLELATKNRITADRYREAIEAYRSEVENSVPDHTMIRLRRQQLFSIIRE